MDAATLIATGPPHLEALVRAWSGGLYETALARERALAVLDRARADGDRATLALGLAYDLLFRVYATQPDPALDVLLSAAHDEIEAAGFERARWLLADARAIWCVRRTPQAAEPLIASAAERLAIAPARRPPRERMWTRIAVLMLCVETRDAERALQHGRALVALGDEAADAVVAHWAQNTLAAFFLQMGDVEAAQDALDKALALLDAMGRESGPTVSNLYYACVLRDDVAGADEVLRRYHLPDVWNTRAPRALHHLAAGRLDAAEALLAEPVPEGALDPRHADVHAWALGRLHLARGRAHEARAVAAARLAQAQALGRAMSPVSATQLHAVVAASAEALGDLDAARGAMRAAAAACHHWVADSVRVRLELLQPSDAPGAEPGLAGWRRATLERARQHAAELPAQAIGRTVSELSLRVLRDVAHEMRNPIGGMMGMTSLLRLSQLSDAQRRIVDAAHGSAHMLLALCNELLDLARIEAGHFQLHPQACDLAATARELTELLRPTLGDKPVALVPVVAADLPAEVWLDDMRVRQVLLNLLGNACKFTRQGRIELRIAPGPAPAGDAARTIRFDVIDTGIGIDADALPQLFDEFYQVRSSDAAHWSGVGIGLSLSRQLVRRMGGDIAAESTVGVGSRFWFELPLVLPQPTDEPAAL